MGADVELVFHTEKVVKTIEDTAAKRMYEAANEVRNTVLETLSGSRAGRTYLVPGTDKTYTASAPGEPPAQATSRLRQDIKVIIKSEGRKVLGMVGTTLGYGKVLEFGSYKMAPRPWLRPSFERSLGKVKSILGRRWMP